MNLSMGLIEVNYTALGSSGFSGTGSMVELSFSPNLSGSSSLQILNPKYGYIGKEVVYLNRYDGSENKFNDALSSVWVA